MRTKLTKIHSVKSHLIVQFDKVNGHASVTISCASFQLKLHNRCNAEIFEFTRVISGCPTFSWLTPHFRISAIQLYHVKQTPLHSMGTVTIIRIIIVLLGLCYLGYVTGQCVDPPSGGFYGWDGKNRNWVQCFTKKFPRVSCCTRLIPLFIP